MEKLYRVIAYYVNTGYKGLRRGQTLVCKYFETKEQAEKFQNRLKRFTKLTIQLDTF